MPEITFTFNVNINCDPKLLNFLDTLQQRIKPVESKKQIVSIPFIQTELKQPYPEPAITTSSAVIPEEQKRTDSNYNSEPIEAICDRIIGFIQDKGGECPLYPNPGLNRTAEVYQAHNDLINHCKCGAKKIVKALRKLDKDGKIEVFRDKSKPHNHPYSYRIIEQKKSAAEVTEIKKPVAKPLLKYKKYTAEDRLNQEEILYNYIKENEPCPIPYFTNPGCATEPILKIHKNLVALLGTGESVKIALYSLVDKKRVEKGKSGKLCIYKVNENEKKIIDLTPQEVKEVIQEGVKENNSKALDRFKKKIKERDKPLQIFKEEIEEEIEDIYRERGDEGVIRADTIIEVPSPERCPKKEIKLKCLKCGGQLFEKNTAEENYMDIESRFLDLPNEIRYQCLSCGRIFKEKEVKKEAMAA